MDGRDTDWKIDVHVFVHFILFIYYIGDSDTVCVEQAMSLVLEIKDFERQSATFEPLKYVLTVGIERRRNRKKYDLFLLYFLLLLFLFPNYLSVKLR